MLSSRPIEKEAASSGSNLMMSRLLRHNPAGHTRRIWICSNILSICMHGLIDLNCGIELGLDRVLLVPKILSVALIERNMDF